MNSTKTKKDQIKVMGENGAEVYIIYLYKLAWPRQNILLHNQEFQTLFSVDVHWKIDKEKKYFI